jgi:hypothetical protein
MPLSANQKFNSLLALGASKSHIAHMNHDARKKRPRDANQLGKTIVDISVGEIDDREPSVKGRAGGIAGGAARAKVLSKSDRVRIAKKAAKVRWKKTGAAARKRAPSTTES